MNTTSKVVGLAVGLLVSAVVMPIGLDMLAGTSTSVDNNVIVENESIGTGDGSTVSFTGNLTETPVVENGRDVWIRATDGGTREEWRVSENDSYADSFAITDYSNAAYDFTFDNAPDNNTPINVDYYYTAGQTDWPSAVGTLLKVLLPVLAVIGVTLMFFKNRT